MKSLLQFSIVSFLLLPLSSFSQEFDRTPSISIFTGAINYQGDLNPNSFTFSHSNIAFGITGHKPLNRWISVRIGAAIGKIEAADKWNRDYLKPRNLSFTSTISEIHAGLELNLTDISARRFTPFLFGGLALFHFNPWAADNAGKKTFLQPLSTEGQGLLQFPDQKPYKLTQVALAFGIGAKYALSDDVNIGIELSQRKSFTDYIDDVSSIYVDKDILLQEKGPKAVEMAYRGGQSPFGAPQYPAHGDQRGTPSEMDWYYFIGITTGIRLTTLSSIFSLHRNITSQRCPRLSGF